MAHIKIIHGSATYVTGECDTKDVEEMRDYVYENLDNLNNFQMMLENGDELVMSSGMVQSSAFLFCGCGTKGV